MEVQIMMEVARMFWNDMDGIAGFMLIWLNLLNMLSIVWNNC